MANEAMFQAFYVEHRGTLVLLGQATPFPRVAYDIANNFAVNTGEEGHYFLDNLCFGYLELDGLGDYESRGAIWKKLWFIDPEGTIPRPPMRISNGTCSLE